MGVEVISGGTALVLMMHQGLLAPSVLVCGTCTVLLDHKVASSCLLLTVQAAGHAIVTPEGLVGGDGGLSAVKEAFVRHGPTSAHSAFPPWR